MYLRFPKHKEDMGQTIKAKITFTCTHEVKKALEALAKAERRTLSNFVEGLVSDIVAAQVPPGTTEKSNEISPDAQC